MIYQRGQELRTISGKTCRVEKFLGGGSQGEVYQVNSEGQNVALKWYFESWATPEQRKNLEYLVEQGAPTSKFLWPVDIVSSPPGFGYLMPLRESRFVSIVALMKRRVEPSFYTLCTAGFELADNFLELHSRGLCYRDISFGNVFLDPDSGEICICDNDNITVDGESGEILGTPSFMAPEIVIGKALPSADTDRFSLAVLLFYIFMLNHPLNGKKESEIRCFDLPARKRVYGEEPVFIFDPNDDSNRPVPGYHDNAIIYWEIYPNLLKKLFIRSFTDGLKDPKRRIRESEWREAIIQLRDSLIYCGHCSSENFYDVTKLGRGLGRKCWSCKSEIQLPPRIKIAGNIVMLNYDTQLYLHHINMDYDLTSTIGKVVRHPRNPNVWGLKNTSKESWNSTFPDGTTAVVPPGKSVTLASGTRVDFGNVAGEVRV